ncbi:MAG: ATP-binding protein [Bacteroidales bacterium]|nr:ATP-binding protein [Bacteroidales bacterium]
MILDFTISNFRSIREPQTISFEASKDTHLEDYYVVKKGDYRILKMAVILGANASGKSNVVKAFDLFLKLMIFPCENKQSKIEYAKFALDKEFAKQDSIIIINFLCGEQKYRYEVHFNNDMITYEFLQRHPIGELRSHKVYERTTNIQSRLSTIKWGEKFRSNSNSRALNVNLIHNRTVFGAFQSSNVDIPWMQEIVMWLNSYVLPTNAFTIAAVTRLLESDYIDKSMMTKQLQKADIGISHFLIERKKKSIPIIRILDGDNDISDYQTFDDIVVRLSHRGKDGIIPFDFEQESGGTQRYFELSGLLLELVDKPHCAVIDELECRLHPDLYTHFITTFLHNAKESQIVFTTHSREFLADKDMFRDDIVWFTEKNDEGATELYSLADFGSDVLRDSSNRYNFYRAGRLGAIPRLGDTYIANSKTIETDGKAI